MPRAFKLAAMPVLKRQPMQPAFLIGVQRVVGVDAPRPVRQQLVQTLPAKLLLQSLPEPVYLRAQARQVVDEAVPQRRLDRLTFRP